MSRSYPVQPSQAVLDQYIRDCLKVPQNFPLDLKSWQAVEYLREWQTTEQAREMFESEQRRKQPTAADFMNQRSAG